VPSEPLLEVMDDVVPATLFAEACKIGRAKGWYYGHGSREGDWGRFWKMDLEGVAVFDTIWENLREPCQQRTGAPLRVLSQYANGHTYGLGGRPHLDDQRPGSYTLLYYPMSEWQDGWDGETVFYDEQGEISLSVRPRPNRAILFDSRILHAGRAPSRECPALRVTVAYKLEAVTEAEKLPAHSSSEKLAAGEHQYTVKVAEDRVRRLVEERLSKLGATVRLPGFRPGKIPMAVLEQRYGASARAEAVKHLADEAAADVAAGSLVAAIDVSPLPGEISLRLTVIQLSELPEPELSGLTLDRLIGLAPDDQEQHVKQQLLDYLERSYAFTLPGPVVEREFAAIVQAAQGQGAVTDAAAAEFRRIAERRVRVGIVVAELARRWGMTGPSVEDLVVNRLISQAQTRERAATAAELRELA